MGCVNISFDSEDVDITDCERDGRVLVLDGYGYDVEACRARLGCLDAERGGAEVGVGVRDDESESGGGGRRDR